ncbi:rRNA maturation RNase YbeY [Seohaeicola sp. SP36]|jgi:probable rRNA maturation factor|uniref:rRNA maturation RNase YbeY n=1 Tax=unclassified Seohaeicola TaxID=2641111 RepID=UPI00237A29D1|nr:MULTISPECIES: rRNA maturation RNase YbeY [unclassified Seohaeicola]MDD9708952.1 rRNA maturation RNase YbeY [Seohaeicola sp. 4SK31]MDD9737038.1 rRNA maturation RNase YbeY [Seohaeicola sp. SP36]MDF1707190.1 rRNA maturation RNase YbeY [Paracoccaceae bacterium]
MLTDTQIEDDRWAQAGLAALAETAACATLTHLGFDPDLYTISLLGCDDRRISVLNAEFRGKPAPTNVLSWPAQDLAAEEEGEAPYVPDATPQDDPFAFDEEDEDEGIALGDIAIAWETCAREAAETGKPLAHHVTHLVVHGTLHLLGYDHVRDKDATLMETIEVAILGKLGVPDPY